MGKRKLKLEKADTSIKRISAFKRRYTTIISKLIELNAFTGSRSLLIMYNGDTNIVYQYTNEFIDSFFASLEEFEGDYLNFECESSGNEEIKIKSELKHKEKGLVHNGSNLFINSKIECTITSVPNIPSKPKENNKIQMETLSAFTNSNPLFQNTDNNLNVDKYNEHAFTDVNSFQENFVYKLLDEF